MLKKQTVNEDKIQKSKVQAEQSKPQSKDRKMSRGEQPAEGSLSFVERELRGIDEAVKSRTSKGSRTGRETPS